MKKNDVYSLVWYVLAFVSFVVYLFDSDRTWYLQALASLIIAMLFENRATHD